MRALKLVALAAAGIALSSAANAAVTITFDGGDGGLAPGETIFANFNSGPGGTNGTLVGGTIFPTSQPGVGVEPAFGDSGDPFLHVGPNDPASFTFGPGGVGSVSLDYGSADSYNTFTICLSVGGCESYNGSQIISASANGDQQSTITNGRLTFTAPVGAVITSLALASTDQALETDNYAVVAGVPEPGTWGMMLLGFGMIGFAGRRRRRIAMLPQAV